MTRRLTGLLVLASALASARADTPLPRDPGNVYGEFPNGLKYIIRPNANPPGRVNMYLHVKTGALNEADDQNGLAHFTEHMAFNGSTHFPPGKLLPMLGGLGMTFGADTNAHTNLWETVYKLNLPNTKPKTIDLGTQIFSDYASGLTLSDAEIESERKVILEEYRTGEGVRKRQGVKERRDVYAGTRLATHDVIGDAEQIKTFPADSFRRYYNAWYRPENMTLIVVGDVKPEDVIAPATKWLSGVSARTPATQPQRAGLTPSTRPRAFVYTDNEQVTGQVSLSNFSAGRPVMTTVEQYRDQVLRGVATAMVNRRFRNAVAAGKAPFRDASVDIDTFLTEVSTAGGEASGEPADWKPMLTALVTEIDRAVEHGFSAAEVKLIERGLIASAEQAVRTEATRDSRTVVNELARDVGQDVPLLSAKQDLELLQSTIKSATPADFAAAFKAAFATDKFDYVIDLPAGNSSVTVPTPAEVLATAQAGWAVKTEAPADTAADGELLAAEPKPGVVVSHEIDDDLKVTTAVFENGVVFHHKFSDYKKDSVLVGMALPGGQLEETDATRGVSDAAELLFNRPATSRFDSTQLADLLTGKNVGVDGSFGRDTLSVQVKASKADLPTGMQLAYALLTDGKLEQAGLDDWKKTELQRLAQEERQPKAQLQRVMARTIFGNDPRFRSLTPADVARVTREQAEAWFKRVAAGSAIEVTVVGDISVEDATALVAKYVGSLPKRERGFDALDALRKIDRSPGPYAAEASFDGVTPQAVGLGGFISCDELNPDRRPLSLAGEVLTTRMIDRIREKEQLVYSISARNAPGRGLPGTGMFSAASLTDPKNGAKLADTVNSMIAEFAKTGPTDEEMVTAKKQIVTEISTAMRDPSWWLGQIGEMKYRGRKLADLKNLPGVFETFSAEDVRSVFAKYAKPDAMIHFVVTPKNASTATTKPAAAK